MEPLQESSPYRSGLTSAKPPPAPPADSAEPMVVSLAAEFAVVIPVPEEYRQRVRGPGYKLKVNLLELTNIVGMFGGGALAVGGAWLIAEAHALITGCVLCASGVPLALWGTYAGVLCAGVTANRWIERRMRREIGRRPDFIVDPRDPDSKYVSLIPRRHFAEIRATYASDLLLIKVDRQHRQLLLEGDCDRYCIPAGAIARCGPKSFTLAVDPMSQLWTVRLIVYFEDDTAEMLLCVDHTRWTPKTGSSRWRTADEMCQRIQALLD